MRCYEMLYVRLKLYLVTVLESAICSTFLALFSNISFTATSSLFLIEERPAILFHNSASLNSALEEVIKFRLVFNQLFKNLGKKN